MKTITVLVHPDARKERFLETKEDSFVISVKEPAAENRANDRVRELLALHYHIGIKQVRIVAGHTVLRKRIHITLTQNGA